MKPRRCSPLVLYLLHFDAPVGRFRHYMGSTFEHLLPSRLKAHSEARGARLTARAARAGIGFTCVDVRFILSRQDEHARKRKGHLKRDCPICQGTPCEKGSLTFSASPVRQPDWSGLSIDL